MAKAYWVATYRSVSDPEALAAYARLAGPAITAAGGRILVRGMPAQVYEAGLQQRTVVIEFDSLTHARRLLAAWRHDYNHVRPHSAHGGLPPATAGERLRNPDQLRRSPARPAVADRL